MGNRLTPNVDEKKEKTHKSQSKKNKKKQDSHQKKINESNKPQLQTQPKLPKLPKLPNFQPARLREQYSLKCGVLGEDDSEFESEEKKGEDEDESIIDQALSQELLLCHHDINLTQINKILQLIQTENNNQLLSFFIDALHLIQCEQICNNIDNLQTTTQFVEKYAIHKHKNFINYPNEFFTTIYQQYCNFVGREALTSTTRYKISDNMSTFMSYTFGMNAAIRQYIKPEPPICPLIIDLWIIPNKVIDGNDEQFIPNDIGNINIRLKQNKTTFIFKRCVPQNTKKFTKQITDCLSNKNIRTEMHKKQLKRMIFIIDRRYNKVFDKLYCILPPKEYATLPSHPSFDILNISHWYCTSKYLLPHTSRYDNHNNHIGSSTNLKGYMFNLSYLIFPNPFQEDQQPQEPQQEQKQEQKQQPVQEEAIGIIENKVNDNDGGYDGFDVQPSRPLITMPLPPQNKNKLIIPPAALIEDSSTSPAHSLSALNEEEKMDALDVDGEQLYDEKKISDNSMDDNVILSAFNDDNNDNNKNDDIQWSTANIKMLFSTQEMTVRFKPSHIIKLWKRFFIKNEKQLILNDANPKNQLKDIVSQLFELNLYDPYFVETMNEIENISHDLKFKYSLQPNARINAPNVLNNYCSNWIKECCQTSTDKIQSKANIQIQLLDKCMPHSNENMEYKSQYLDCAVYEKEILVESDSYFRPEVIINYHSIYDCITWKNQANISPHSMQEYVANELKLQNMIKTDEKQEPIEEMKYFEKTYEGSKFLSNNESLLINDAIVSYAYYLCIVSHILCSLMQEAKHCPFQFTITFICKSVLSTDGNKVRRPHLDNYLLGLKRKMTLRGHDGLSLPEHIQEMAAFLSPFFRSKNSKNKNQTLKKKRINLIIDRRQSKINSNECVCYTRCTRFDPADPQRIIKMNVKPSIPKLKAKVQGNSNLFHINFYNFKPDEIMAYFIRSQSCIRFFPELMMNMWPKIFYGDPKSLLDIVYKHKFRHSFAVKLQDKQFTQNYYAIFNQKFVSINYFRPMMNIDEDSNDDSQSQSDSDGPLPFLKRYLSQEFVGLTSEQCHCNEEILQNFYFVSSDDYFEMCPLIKRIAFLMSHQNSSEKIEKLIEIFRDSGYTVTNLMDDVFHLFDQHKFVSNDTAHAKIKKYIINDANIEECDDDDCDAMQRHCRKAASSLNVNAVNTNNKSNPRASEWYKHKNEEIKTWISQFDKIHCSLFHNKAKTFRFRYGRMRSRSASKRSPRNINIAPTIHEIPVGLYCGKFSKLKFGVSVDEWLPRGNEPQFVCMEEEVLKNKYEPVDGGTLKQIKYEVKSRYFSLHSNKQHLSVEEILSLKLFTDLDNLQKEFSKAFWDGGIGIVTRRCQFYHWANVLRRAFKYGNVPIRERLYRGYDTVLQLPSFNPFCGQPTSTTRDVMVADQFAENKGIVVSSNTAEIVYGMDVSWFSRFQNEKEVWIYDQIFPIEKAMVVLDNETVILKYIEAHLVEINHQLTDIRQFLYGNYEQSESYIQQIKNKTALLKTGTKYAKLNVFERLFFEWKRYELRIPKMKELHTALDSFEQLIGEHVYLHFEAGYFYITGIRDIVIDTFNPTTFRIEYIDHNYNKHWHKYFVNTARLDRQSKNLIPVRNQQIKYRFVAEFSQQNINVEEKQNQRYKILVSETKSLDLTVEQVIEIENTMQKTQIETKYEEESSDSDTDDSKTLSIIEQIDRGLGKYYHQHERRDDYYNESGEGLFKLYCEDNGFGDDDVEAELEADPTECMLLDMDEDFPFKKQPVNEEKWQIAVFNVIKRCYEDSEAFMHELQYEIFEITANDFNIRRDCNEVKHICNIHKRQTPTIYRKGFQEDRLITRLLAVSARTKQPYLQLVADMYARDRFKTAALNIETWAQRNKHLLKLKKLVPNQQAYRDMQAALKSWYHIIAPILMMHSQTRIDDCLRKTCEYVTHAVDFVHNFAAKNEDLLPFQYDYCIAFPKVSQDTSNYMRIYDDDDDDDDDETDEEERALRDEYAFVDCVGDIKAKLNNNNCVYAASVIEANKVAFGLTQTKIRSNVNLNARFMIFKREKLNKKYTGHDLNEYPKRKRFCTLIDRRGQKNDKCIFYEPPANCNTFPREDHSSLWYFNASSTCLIPCIGYDEGRNEMMQFQQHMSTRDKLLAQNINANSHCKGGVMTFSFHVESLKEIRCYMYLNGQMSRFFPQDILDILPGFFIESDANKAFATSKEIKQMVKYMTPKLRDLRFETFYKQNS